FAVLLERHAEAAESAIPLERGIGHGEGPRERVATATVAADVETGARSVKGPAGRGGVDAGREDVARSRGEVSGPIAPVGALDVELHVLPRSTRHDRRVRHGVGPRAPGADVVAGVARHLDLRRATLSKA